MKNITKDNRGITLIALIITIIIMLILVSVTTYTGLDTYRHSQVNKFVTQMQLLQAKVDDLVVSNAMDELNNMSLQSVTTENQTNAIANAFKQGEITTADTSKYKVFTKDDILNILDVEDVQDDIMVNFETREIVSTVGIEYDEITYYTQYKLPSGQTIIDSTETNRNLNFEFNVVLDGLNATIKISNVTIRNGSISYREYENDYWTVITNHTEKEKEYVLNFSKTGRYIFRLQDNVDSENYLEVSSNIVTTNKPKTDIEIGEYNYASTSEEWAYIQKGSTSYVWIPRFAYKTNETTNTTEIKFIKGNSNISTENTLIDNTWNIHERFTTDNKTELTGIWVSVENINQTGLDMITLLNDGTRTMLIEI